MHKIPYESLKFPDVHNKMFINKTGTYYNTSAFLFQVFKCPLLNKKRNLKLDLDCCFVAVSLTEKDLLDLFFLMRDTAHNTEISSPSEYL